MSIDRSPDQAVAPSALQRSEVLSGLAVLALLGVILPLVVCMPVSSDTAFYDICARQVLRGGALERDFLYLMPPGQAWAMAAVRFLLGTSSEAMHLADLAVFGAIVWLLLRWLRDMGLPRLGRIWAAFAMLGLYLTASEWVQNQPDTWMLLPSLAALHLRRRQVIQLTAPAVSDRRVFGFSFVEGLLWGAGCLIKPFVVVPGLLTWFTSAALVRRTGSGWAVHLAWDAGGLVLGGLLMGGVWQGWLLAHGTFETFWENYTQFKDDYYVLARPLGQRVLIMLAGLPPWGLLHLAALPLALVAVTRGVIRPFRPDASAPSAPIAQALAAPLLAGFYLGWVIEGNFLQFQLGYHMVPGHLLALTVIVASLRAYFARWGRLSVAFVAVAVFGSVFQPAFAPSRLALWWRCWCEGSSPELRDQLAIGPTAPFAKTDWQDLKEVERFLRDRQVADGELLCYHLSCVHLHPELGVQPSSRFLYPSVQLLMFPSHRADILQELQSGRQRYIVTDVREMLAFLPRSESAAIPANPAAETEIPPSLVQKFPYTEPVVFSSGCYRVHEMRRPERHP